MNSSFMEGSWKEQFLNPSGEFTPFPFWFWNDDLREETIRRQIEDFHQKGVDGFVIHPRIGIPADTPYLSDRFMQAVKFAVEEARRRQMRVVLYDEAMYPSGSAHGMVVAEHPEFATKALRMERIPYTGQTRQEILGLLEEGEQLISLQTVQAKEEDRQDLLCFIQCDSRGSIRGIHEGEDDGQPMVPPSADLLNPEAMKLFIHITHDRYYEVLREYFGSTVIAMFTDEPDVLGRRHRRGVVPWTEGFLDWWERSGGREDQLPLLWLEGEGAQEVRRNFQKAVNKRLGESYYAQLSQWCEGHGIALTGHPAKSCDIGFLPYFQIPGQDLVYRWVAPEENKALEGPDSTMAKCSSDAARHSKRSRNSNECFGCCGPKENQWAFTADNMKWFLDWLFVRGVNMLYPHAFFYSIRGEIRYGERPPDVGPHNIWWQDYRMFSDYMKRMCWLMTDSANTTPIAILCEEDNLPWRMAGELFRNQIEFNYLEENLICPRMQSARRPENLSDDTSAQDCIETSRARDCSGKVRCRDGRLWIEKQCYSLLLVESEELLTPNLRACLSAFLEQGGRILVLRDKASANGKNPAFSVPEKGISYLSRLEDLIPALDTISRETGLALRELKLLPGCEDLRISHVVKENDGSEKGDFYLFVNEGEQAYEGRVFLPIALEEGLSAEWWHPWEGSWEPAAWESQEGGVTLPISLNRRESLILVTGQAAKRAVQESDQGTAKRAVQESVQGAVKGAVQGADQGSLARPSQEIRIPLKELTWKILRITPSPVIAEAGLAETDPSLLPEVPREILLGDWTAWKGMEHFSGTVCYKTTFLWNPGQIQMPAKRILLDLGEVSEIARLTLNGRFLGVQMWAPYQFEITDALKEGENRLQLEISNSLANGMGRSSLPSGLMGPIALRLLPQ